MHSRKRKPSPPGSTLAVRHEYGRQFAAAAEKFGKTAAAIINLSESDMRDIFQAKNIPVFDAATDACFRMLRGYKV